MSEYINKNELIDSYKSALAEGRYQEAGQIADSLLGASPNEIEYFILKYHALDKAGAYLEAMQLLERASEISSTNPKIVFLKRVVALDIRRSLMMERTRLQRRHEVISRHDECDVICIASNEGPYIASFIHHYLKLGFANIYIGINDSSHDETYSIVSKISTIYPNVKIVDTNGSHANMVSYSRESYGIIWAQAAVESTSKYAFIVDVDEYLILPAEFCTISHYIRHFTDFDCQSFSYLEQTGCQKKFAHPFDLSNPSIAPSPFLKSIVSYDVELADLHEHVPSFKQAEFLKVITATGEERFICNNDHNIMRFSYRLSDEEIAKLDYTKHAFVFHIRNRSELEYAMKCINPWPGFLLSFYHNRHGFRVPSNHQEYSEILFSVINNIYTKKYVESYDEFCSLCNVTGEIKNSKERITEERLLNFIDSLSEDTIIKEKNIWMRSLSGTKYLAYLNEKISQE